MQGHALTAEEVERIIWLLDHTEMTMPEIAQRMHCSRSAVVSINRRFKVREYLGLRSVWQKRLTRDAEPLSVLPPHSFSIHHYPDTADPGDALKEAADHIREIVNAQVNAG